MATIISLEDYKKALRTVMRQKAKKEFNYHLAAYILVNTFLLILNLLRSPAVLWALWPIFGWGIGIISHYFFGVKKIDDEIDHLEYKAERLITSTEKQNQNL